MLDLDPALLRIRELVQTRRQPLDELRRWRPRRAGLAAVAHELMQRVVRRHLNSWRPDRNLYNQECPCRRRRRP